MTTVSSERTGGINTSRNTVRHAATGDYSHPTMVYVIAPDGRTTSVTPGRADLIAAAVKGL